MDERKLNEIVGTLKLLQEQVNRAYHKAECEGSFGLYDPGCEECRDFEFCKTNSSIDYLLKELEK